MPPKKKALPTPRPSITSELKKSPKLPQKQSPAQKASSSASKPKTNGTGKASKRKTDDSDDYDDDSEDEEPMKKPHPKPKGVPSKDTRKVDDDKMDVDLKGKGKATEEIKDVAKKFKCVAVYLSFNLYRHIFLAGLPHELQRLLDLLPPDLSRFRTDSPIA